METSSKFFLILPSLFLVMIFPFDVYGIESEKNQNTFSTIVNSDIIGFSLEYPQHFEIKENILDSQGWMFSLNDTKDQTITLDVFALPLDPELISVQDKAIIDYMFLLNFHDCDQATLNQTGYECFNFSPLDYDINHHNEIEYFEIKYSILTKNTMGNYTDRTKIVTDIWLPSENHLLSIHGAFDPEEYLESKSVYDEIVKSINFEVSSMSYPDLPIELKIKAALWTQDLIDNREFFGFLSQIIESESKSSYSSSKEMPNWLKNSCKWWVDGKISDIEFYNLTNYLYHNRIIHG